MLTDIVNEINHRCVLGLGEGWLQDSEQMLTGLWGDVGQVMLNVDFMSNSSVTVVLVGVS